jgi:hypothetical protein
MHGEIVTYPVELSRNVPIGINDCDFRPQLDELAHYGHIFANI